MNRSTAREVAMKLIYSGLVGGEDTPLAVLEKSEIDEVPEEKDEEFIRDLVEGTNFYAPKLDELIAAYSIDWPLDRISKVDLAILRLAVFEIRYREDPPVGAAIDEAVELAKKFGGEKSYAFVNGVLGAIARNGGTPAEGNAAAAAEE